MRIFILTLASCIMAQQASATVIYSNDFEAEALGSAVSTWNNEPTTPWLVANDATGQLSGRVYFNAGSSANANQNNVGVNFSSTVLGATGDFIRTTFDYVYSAAPTGTADPFQAFNFFRFGMYTNDGSSPPYVNDNGYLADLSYWDNTGASTGLGKFGDFSVREENNVFADTGGPLDYASILLDNKDATHFEPPAFGTDGDILSINTGAKTTLDGLTKHTAVLTVLRTATGVEVQLSQDGTTVASGMATNPYYTFDTLYFEGPANNLSGFAVDNLLIETGAVPEPSRMLLLGLGICGLMIRRRR